MNQRLLHDGSQHHQHIIVFAQCVKSALTHHHTDAVGPQVDNLNWGFSSNMFTTDRLQQAITDVLGLGQRKDYIEVAVPTAVILTTHGRSLLTQRLHDLRHFAKSGDGGQILVRKARGKVVRSGSNIFGCDAHGLHTLPDVCRQVDNSKVIHGKVPERCVDEKKEGCRFTRLHNHDCKQYMSVQQVIVLLHSVADALTSEAAINLQ